MTISSELSRVSYNCDGSTKTFSVPFAYYDTGHLVVVLVTAATGAEQVLVLDTDYGLTPASGAGGTVTTLPTAAYTSEYRLVIYRHVPALQETDLIHGGALPAEPVEQTFDRAVMMIQQLAENIARAIKLPVGSLLSGVALPVPGADRFLRWNAAGTALEAVELSVVTDLLIARIGGNAAGDIVTVDDIQTLINKRINEDVMLIATSTQINAKCNSESFCTHSDGLSINNTEINVASVITESTWESIGPTGSGANNIWTALDVVPPGSDWIMLRFRMILSGGIGGDAFYLWGRKTGSVAGISSDTMYQYSQLAAGSLMWTDRIAVDASRRFDMHWQATQSSVNLELWLVGYGFNP